MRVAMIIQGYLPRLGGAERQLASLAPLLQQHGVKLHVLTRRYPGLAAREQIGGVPVYRLPAPGPGGLKSLVFSASALALLRRLRPQVLHAYDLLSPTTTALLARRMLGAPVVVKVLRGGQLGDLERLRSKPFARLRIRQLRRQVDAFMVISHEIDQELAAIGVAPEKRRRIPNGVDLTRFSPLDAEDKRALRRQLGLAEAPVALYSGRLVPEKRVGQLVELWPAVREQHPGAELLLAGSGPEEPELRRRAGAGVRLLGQLDDIAPHLRAADLFVLPSATEGLSNALLEALAAGLPAVATAVGGAPETIEHGRSGWLVPPDSPQALRQAILQLLGDPAHATELGRRGRQQMAERYALPIVAEKLVQLYHELAQHGLDVAELKGTL